MYRNALQRGPLTPLLSTVRNAAKNVKIENPSADMLPYKGKPASNKPIKVALDTGKTYVWCSCGLSKTEPFCDGTHKMNGITNVRPVRFQVEKSGEYYMCNCKLTSTRPICDRSHKEVSAAPRDFNATRFVMFGDNSPVYDGVARKLGYKPKNGGFQ